MQRLLLILASLAALALLGLGTLAVAAPVPPQEGPRCHPLNPNFEPPDGCANPLNGCICVWNVSIAVGTFADCGGCYVRFTGTRDCTHPFPDKNYDETLSAQCGYGTNKVEACPCDNVQFQLFTMSCKICPE